MTQRGCGFLCDDHRAADGAVLSFGLARLRAGRGNGCVNDLCMAVGGDFSRFKGIAAGADTFFFALFGTSGGLRLRPVAVVVTQRGCGFLCDDHHAAKVAVLSFGLARLSAGRGNGCVNDLAMSCRFELSRLKGVTAGAGTLFLALFRARGRFRLCPCAEIVAQRGYGFLRDDHRAADGAALAFGLARLGAGGGNGCVNNLAMSCRFEFSRLKGVAAGAGALFLALFGAGRRLRLCPFAVVMSKGGGLLLRDDHRAANEAMLAFGLTGLGTGGGNGCVNNFQMALRSNHASLTEHLAAVQAIDVARIAVFRAGHFLCAAKLSPQMLAVNAADFRAVTDTQAGENLTRFAALVHIAGADANAGNHHADL